ncbi:hypothetical protein [Larsenimonas salina]|uniref:hypothetical protein n=1 Tax=Larsenimonas salina TaxID=1295565 RepID=UPI002072A55B|nr:hypothetical protein [Larsenimonas salina]MCM5704848.1 hypothetical protein [Larsenimonas salina]
MATCISDINDRFDYADELPDCMGNFECVPCGRAQNYSELTYIYMQFLAPKIAANECSEQDALDALEKACMELPTPRSRSDFYAFLEEELNIDLDY